MRGSYPIDPYPYDGYRYNSARGCGSRFGPNITAHFLNKNKLNMIVRSHEVCEKGYDVMHDNRLMTLFSAPHYCNREMNLGAILKIDSHRGNELNETNKDEALMKITQFNSTHYPCYEQKDGDYDYDYDY